MAIILSDTSDFLIESLHLCPSTASGTILNNELHFLRSCSVACKALLILSLLDMMAVLTPRNFKLVTWLTIKDVNRGDSTSTKLQVWVLTLPNLWSYTNSNSSKQTDFPNPVGSQTNTSLPPKIN